MEEEEEAEEDEEEDDNNELDEELYDDSEDDAVDASDGGSGDEYGEYYLPSGALKSKSRKKRAKVFDATNPKYKDVKVLVIGAGIAGITAARKLRYALFYVCTPLAFIASIPACFPFHVLVECSWLVGIHILHS